MGIPSGLPVVTNLWITGNRTSYFDVGLGLVFVILNGFPCDPDNEMGWEIKKGMKEMTG